MQRQVKAAYRAFYEDIALYPEVGRFRRFGEQWAKKVYDDAEEVLIKEKRLNDSLKNVRVSDSGVTTATALDFPRSFLATEIADERLNEEWKAYEESLMKYGQTLCLSEQIFKLPDHASYATKFLSEAEVFENKKFGPTGEEATTYLGPSHLTDTCAWRAPLRKDRLSTFFMDHGKWVEQHLLKRVRRLYTPKSSQTARRTNIPYDRIVGVMDILTCIFVPILLTAAMFVLAGITPLMVRIAIVGVFGLVFSLSVKIIAGHPTRGEVFSATSAFFAVASVFVGSTSNNGSCL